MIEDQWKKPVLRPIAVYVWTIIIFLRFGLFQFIMYFNAVRDTNGDAPLPFVVVSFALPVFTAAAAIWAFIGDNEGRISLMILVAVNILWSLYVFSMILVNPDKEIAENALPYIINLVFWCVLMIPFYWYFFSKEVVAYYKQSD